MRRLLPFAFLLGGCERSSVETGIAFVVIFWTLIRILVDHDAR